MDERTPLVFIVHTEGSCNESFDKKLKLIILFVRYLMTHFLNFELQAVQSKTLVPRTDFLTFLKITLLILVYLKKVCLKHRVGSIIQHQFV